MGFQPTEYTRGKAAATTGGIFSGSDMRLTWRHPPEGKGSVSGPRYGRPVPGRNNSPSRPVRPGLRFPSGNVTQS